MGPKAGEGSIQAWHLSRWLCARAAIDEARQPRLEAEQRGACSLQRGRRATVYAGHGAAGAAVNREAISEAHDLRAVFPVRVGSAPLSHGETCGSSCEIRRR